MFEEIVGSEAKLYCTRFADGTAIFYRLLTLEELNRVILYKEISQVDDAIFFENIYNYCVLSPYKNLGGQIRAGVLSSIGQFIFEFSQSTENVEEEIEKARTKFLNTELTSFVEDLKKVICSAYPSYTLEELDKKTKHEIIELFVRAEFLLQFRTKNEYKPINTKTLRKASQQSTIDFEKENREITKAGFGKEDSPWGRNGDAHRLQQVREQAAARASRRS